MANTLQPLITAAGLAALVAANKAGLDAQITHIALGDGNGVGYEPQRLQTALKRERVRVPVGGGEAVSPTEFVVQGLVDAGPAFWVREVAFVVDNTVLLAIWSDLASPLMYYQPGQQLILDFYVALEGIPPGSVTISITNPTINIIVAKPLAQLAAASLRHIRRTTQTEVERLTPQLQSRFR